MACLGTLVPKTKTTLNREVTRSSYRCFRNTQDAAVPQSSMLRVGVARYGRVTVGVAWLVAPNDLLGADPGARRRWPVHAAGRGSSPPQPPQPRHPGPLDRPRPGGAQPSRILHAAFRELRGGRQLRSRAPRAGGERAPPSRLRHQGDDPLPAVRAAGTGPADSRDTHTRVGSRRLHVSDQARPAARLHHPRRRRHRLHRHQVRQRHGGGGGRGRRRRRAELRAPDDPQGTHARHGALELRQRLGPTRRSADDDRARPGPARPRHPRPLSPATSIISRFPRSTTPARPCPTTTT